MWRGRRRGAGRGWCGRWLGGWRRATLPDARGPRRSVRCRSCGDGGPARSAGRGCGRGWRWRAESGADVSVGDGVEIAVEADVGGLAGADGADEFGLEGMSGSSRGFSSAQTLATVRSGISGRRWWATSSRQRRNWALRSSRSSRSRKGRAAKKACRRYWICLSIFPFFKAAECSRCC